MPTDPRHTSHLRDAFAGQSTSCGRSFGCLTHCVLLETVCSSICGQVLLADWQLASLFFALAELRSERLLPRRESSRLTPHTWKILELASIPKQTTCLIRRGVGSSWRRPRENETDFSKYDAELVNFGHTLQSLGDVNSCLTDATNMNPPVRTSRSRVLVVAMASGPQ